MPIGYFFVVAGIIFAIGFVIFYKNPEKSQKLSKEEFEREKGKLIGSM
jgi:hypothetical protein